MSSDTGRGPSPPGAGAAPCDAVACLPTPAAETAPAGPLAASAAGGGGGQIAAFVVLSVLLAALVVIIIVGLAQRRRGCRLLRPSTWRRGADEDPPVKPPAGPPPDIRIVPLVVVMPDQQVQCALEASTPSRPPSHSSGAGSSLDAWHGGLPPAAWSSHAHAPPTIVVERPAAEHPSNGKQPVE
ncbi:family transcriptional regulator [Micractinium conductrix]|uniref:Family transcriptional regulator n=1 Tax=Micractinium conductrix TaxID=554055 RepID=A0A2P6V328_9CHLO|nr:family transcriptional regulator [Micractinium conductrix]|eukprot:PSC68477.1 family transcriptional regulator [Micractinium conductrix]